MSIESAKTCIELVGKTIRPAIGTERWARANGKPHCGVVTDVHIPSITHPYIVCDFGGETTYLFAFEVDVITH